MILRCCRVTPALRTLSCSHSRYGRCSQMIVVKHHPTAYLQLPADIPKSTAHQGMPDCEPFKILQPQQEGALLADGICEAPAQCILAVACRHPEVSPEDATLQAL